MSVTVKNNVSLPSMAEEIRKILSSTLFVGPVAEKGSELAIIAASNEFGAVIKPKSGKYLAIPIIREAKGKRPSDFSDLFFVEGKNKGHAFLSRKKGESVEHVFLLKTLVKIPERAYIRVTFDSAVTHEKIKRVAIAMMNRVLAGSANANDFLTAIGEAMAASVKLTITGGIDPQNSELTLSMKKGTTPLYDEGDLLKSISYEVR